MSSAALELPHSNRRRWIVLFALIFAAQLVLIILLSSRGQTARRVSQSSTPLQLFPDPLTDTQFSENFLVSDPTLFAVASRSGFSGPAWLKTPSRLYEESGFNESIAPSFWLPLNLQQLGNDIKQFLESNSLAPVAISENPAPLLIAQTSVETEKLRTESQFRVEGKLATRQLLTPPQLSSWEHTELLKPTVAQLAVDKGGTVLSARLLFRSGLPKADNAALEIARTLKFLPNAHNELTWGTVVFDWHTRPVAETNATVKLPQP